MLKIAELNAGLNVTTGMWKHVLLSLCVLSFTACPDDEDLEDAGSTEEDNSDDGITPNPEEECGNGIVDEGETCDTNGIGADRCLSEEDCLNARNGASCWNITYSQSDATNPCTSRCEVAAISLPEDGDNCCPEGADGRTDSDCPQACGNGVIDAGETCDNGEGSPTPCPTSCDDENPCTRDTLVGNGCESTCENVAITTAVNGDGCCPDGVDVGSDSDCDVVCGDGVVSPSERCDDGAGSPETCPIPSDCDDSDPCTVDTISGSGCQQQCSNTEVAIGLDDQCCPTGATYETDADCEAPEEDCGNGDIDTGETCDDGTGSPTPCPQSAGDCYVGPLSPCTIWVIDEQGTCRDTCREITVTTPVPDETDGCCPGVQYTPSDDPDCVAPENLVPLYGICEADADCATSGASCVDFARYGSFQKRCSVGCDGDGDSYDSNCPEADSEALEVGDPLWQESVEPLCVTRPRSVQSPRCLPIDATPYIDNESNGTNLELLPAAEGEPYSNIQNEYLNEGAKDLYFMKTGDMSQTELWDIWMYPDTGAFFDGILTVLDQTTLPRSGVTCRSVEIPGSSFSNANCYFEVNSGLDDDRFWLDVERTNATMSGGTSTYDLLFRKLDPDTGEYLD